MSVRKPAPAQAGGRLSHVMQVGYAECMSFAAPSTAMIPTQPGGGMLPDKSPSLIPSDGSKTHVKKASDAMAKRAPKLPHWSKSKMSSQKIAVKLMKVFENSITESVFKTIQSKATGVEVTMDSGMSIIVTMRIDQSVYTLRATTTDFDVPEIESDIMSSAITRTLTSEMTYRQLKVLVVADIAEVIDQIKNGRGSGKSLFPEMM